MSKDIIRSVIRFSSGKNKQLVLGVEILLVIVLMNLLVSLFWQAFENTDSSMVRRNYNSSALGVSESHRETDQYAGLDAFELFGQEKALTVKLSPASIATIPRSRLPIRVTGLLAYPDSGVAIAIIEVKGQQRSYRIGEVIDGSRAKITSIYPDRVIVEDKGKKQALMLYADQKTSTLFEATPITDKTKSETINTADIIANPQKLTELISISPVTNDGRLKGYRVNPRKPSKLFTQSGLKPNDLVVEINGNDLTDPAAAMALLENLDAFERIDLTVEREGMLYQVELSL